MKDLIPNQRKFIFIGGLHRSGTSLLHSILRSQEQISGFENTGVCEDEGQHLQTVYLTAKMLGGPGKFGFNSSSYMDETHLLANPSTAEILWNNWKPYWNLSKTFLLEKSPPNLIRTRFLQSLFPNSVFIIILRHPVAVAYATRKWCDASIPSMVEHNLHCYERFQKDQKHLNNVHVLRYEDFVLHPQQHVDNLLDSMQLNLFKVQQQICPNVNDKYFKEWQQDKKSFLKAPFYRWAGFMNSFEKRANAFGYTLTEPEQLLPVNKFELPLMTV